MSSKVKLYAVVDTSKDRVYLASDMNDAKSKLQQIVELATAMAENKYQKYVDYPNNRAYTYKVIPNFNANKMCGTVVTIEHCEAYNKNLGLSIEIEPSNEVIETMCYRIMEVCNL